MIAALSSVNLFRGPLILPIMTFTLGIAGAYYLNVPRAGVAIPLVTTTLALLLLVRPETFFTLVRPETFFTPVAIVSILLLPLFFFAGYSLTHFQLASPTAPEHIYNLLTTTHDPDDLNPDAFAQRRASHDLVLVGTLRELPRFNRGRTSMVLEVTELHRTLGKTPAHGQIKLTVNGPMAPEITPGTSLIVRARVGPVRSFRVPGAFDYQQFLARQGIKLSGWVDNPAHIAKIWDDRQTTLALRLRYLPEQLRAKASDLLNLHLDGPTRPVIRALLIGDYSEIAPATMEIFKASGAMHLLAISGMHMSLIAMMSMVVIEWLLKRSTRIMLALPVRKVALLLALIPIIAYALITGLQPPAVRALIMTLVFMAAILSNRQWCSLNNLALAALIILILDPPVLFGASFQLSFVATAGIIMLVPGLQARYEATYGFWQKILFWIITSLLVSTVATLVTAPLAIHHFHRVSLLSPITTLLATPLLFFWTMPVALIGLALAATEIAGLASLGGLLLQVSTWGIAATMLIATPLAALPFSFFYLAPLTGAEITVWIGLFIALALLRRHWFFPLAAALAALLLFLLPVHGQWQRQQNENSRISFLEVGHGSATVLEMPGNRTILVDGGGPSSLSTDVGERLIAPFLRHRRIRRLEAVVITHPHADHYNGIPFILRHFRPKVLWINGEPTSIPDYLSLLALAQELGIDVQIPVAGQAMVSAPKITGDKTGEVGQAGKGEGADSNGTGNPAELRNLADFHLRELADFIPPLTDPGNDRGLIASYRHATFALLLPGDISMGQEKRLLGEFGHDLPHHQVLAASHHGRRDSMAPEFVAAIAPKYIIVSDDERRIDLQRVNSWRDLGAKVFTTGHHGTIVCTTDGLSTNCQPTHH